MSLQEMFKNDFEMELWDADDQVDNIFEKVSYDI